MSFGLVLVGFLVTASPPRFRLGLEAADVEARLAVVLGVLVAFGLAGGLAAGAGALLDAIEVSAESFLLAAALVLSAEGVFRLMRPCPSAEPALGRLGAAVVPVAFPLLLEPGLVVLAVAAGGDSSTAVAVGALAAALAVAAVAGVVPRRIRRATLYAAGVRVLAGFEVAVGAVLAVDAVRAI
jgi:hypothetical protein